MVFYRKYRPEKFDEVIGQDHIRKTLINALVKGNFSHGYLFSGPRGSGKTTLARIFAKALNCSGRKITKDSYEPCLKCSSCQEIAASRSMDVIEVDAASNRGIDEIRELREKIRFAPTAAVYKIYIIDEVHMLTKEAFNALLKTLEEPPKHAVFIFATTEAHKVLPTILSRVQRFDFHKATVEEITRLINDVAKKEKIVIEPAAVGLLAQLSYGAFRDGLSIFDQVASTVKKDEKITLEKVQEILGLAQEKAVFDFLDLLVKNDRTGLFKLTAELYFQGVDLENFTQSLITVLRKIALYKMGQNELFDLTSEQQAAIKEIAPAIELETLMSLIEKLIEIIPKIKSANLAQLPLEMVIFEYTTGDQNSKIDKLEIKSIEKEKPVEESKDRVIEKDVPGVIKKPVIAVVDTGQPFDVKLWPEVVSAARKHNHNLAAILRDAVIVEAEGENIKIAFKFKFHAETIGKRQNRQKIEQMIQEVAGSPYILECIVDPSVEISVPKDKDEAVLEEVEEIFGVEE